MASSGFPTGCLALAKRLDLAGQRRPVTFYTLKGKIREYPHKIYLFIRTVNDRLGGVNGFSWGVNDRLRLVNDRLGVVNGRSGVVNDRLRLVNGRSGVVNDRLRLVNGRLRVVNGFLRRVNDRLACVNDFAGRINGFWQPTGRVWRLNRDTCAVFCSVFIERLL